MMHDLTDKQLRILRDRSEPGLKQGAQHPPRDPLACMAYVMLTHFAMALDSEIARRAEQQSRSKNG